MSFLSILVRYICLGIDASIVTVLQFTCNSPPIPCCVLVLIWSRILEVTIIRQSACLFGLDYHVVFLYCGPVD